MDCGAEFLTPPSPNSVPSAQHPVDADGNPLKPCCACPDTRTKRDDCVLLNGEENCTTYIEAHKDCLRSYGFIV